jgi:hypothetical protein
MKYKDGYVIGDWEICFAFLPVITLSGRIVWLCKVERRFNQSLNSWGDGSGYSGTDGGYEYRLPKISLRCEA